MKPSLSASGPFEEEEFAMRGPGLRKGLLQMRSCGRNRLSPQRWEPGTAAKRVVGETWAAQMTE
jgi:hypothetical protein